VLWIVSTRNMVSKTNYVEFKKEFAGYILQTLFCYIIFEFQLLQWVRQLSSIRETARTVF